MPEAHAPDLPSSEADLLHAGFRPSRHRRAVYWMRRVLWPLMRPFHFYTLHRVIETNQRLDGLEALTERLAALIPAAEAACRAELAPIVAAHAEHRAEMTSLANRHAGVEDLLAETDLRVEAVDARVTAVDARATEVDARVAKADARAAAIDLRVLTLEQRLFLQHADQGIFVLKSSDLISEAIRRDGHWDAHILAIARRAASLRPGGRAVDAGAHFGALSVPFGSLFGKVASFEPNLFSASLLRANVALNNLSDRVAVFPIPLFSRRVRLSLASGELQEIPLSLTPGRGLDLAKSENLGAYSFAEHGTGVYEAEARLLDDFAFDDLAFLKVDTQGADGEVIAGAMRTIERCRCWIVFEWEEHLSRNYGVSFDQLAGRLEAAGYVVQVCRRHNEKQVDYVAVPQADLAALGDPTG